MNKIFKKFAAIIAVGTVITSCETTDLDLTVSPNELSPTQSDPNLLLNSIQLAYASNQYFLSEDVGELTRIDYFFGRNYFNALPGSDLNATWARTYSSGGTIIGDPVSVGILTNLQTLEQINAETDTDLSFHIGLGKLMYAHSLFQLVDMLGVAAFSQAGNPAEFPAPALDSGEEVYAGAFGLLSEAEALLSSGPSTNGATDMFYGGDTDKWIKAINSIRLRSYKNTGNKSAFDAIVAGGNYIADEADDLEFSYGTSALQPDDRHPLYAAAYAPAGSGPYRSNYLMDLMLQNDDPRIRYYFYRQSDGTPGALDVGGNPVPPNEETISCSLFTPPPHYAGFVYCSVDNGYWGRSHGNDEGGPPDGFLKAAPGVYPTAGRFDDSQFNEVDAVTGVNVAPGVGIGQGGGGAGITPIILSSYVDFWIGEMAASDAERSAAMRAGLEKSIAKVQTFGALDSSADLSFEPSADDVEAYIDGIVAAFDAATGDDKENIFAEQYFVTLYGGAFESYNYYRKTGFPTTVFPNWEPDPGPFPRTYLLPQNEVLNNPNVTQRTDLNTQVFWDTNPASPTFPPAN
ncbi:SusD/RagB family nutrient-binding outer membrane lipoprotein [Croceivirga thetidis]|uniref:SusD/RagB family nutrient-binding outer membrane lipoprotein n=1 Tax=Croceivirga thetidis TaxID=2721623 RepID=A0ABX1GW85_9FLAO|nr:SusD/RagB family nutrient-binding outer membrane lipoprotein [Croceivirga thetidis]NKI33235.1 SusD/RagB family nutrient-binding outer membrane lipoprotein [Croceivirga thetidis]